MPGHDLAPEPDVRPRARWLFAAAALVAGLLAGFVAGMTLASQGGDDPYASGGVLAAGRVDRTLERAALQSPQDEPSTEPAAAPINDAAINGAAIDDAAIDNAPRPPDAARGTQPQNVAEAPLRAAAPSAHTAATGGFGVLHLESYPAGAQVYVDDRPVVTTPFRLSGVAPGLHVLRMEMEGYRSWSTSVRVGAGALVRISAPLEDVVGQ